MFDPAGERFTSLFLSDLELPRPRELCFRYDVVELSTAVRPFLLRHLLRERGLRVTKPRLTVLEILSHGGHLEVEEITRLARSRLDSVSTAFTRLSSWQWTRGGQEPPAPARAPAR